jgi:hypothetical protein
MADGVSSRRAFEGFFTGCAFEVSWMGLPITRSIDEVLKGSSGGGVGDGVSSRCALGVSSGCTVETSWVGLSIANKIATQTATATALTRGPLKKTALAKYIPSPRGVLTPKGTLVSGRGKGRVQFGRRNLIALPAKRLTRSGRQSPTRWRKSF